MNFLPKVRYFFVLNTANFFSLAWVASVSVANFDVLAARKLGREQKTERRGRGRGEKETLANKPLEFEKPVRQRTGFVISSALVLIIDICPSKLWFCQNTHNVLRFRASSFWNFKTSDCYSFPGRRRTWPEPSVKPSIKLTRTFPELILRTNFTWRPPREGYLCWKTGRDYRYFPFLIFEDSPAQILKFFSETHRLFFSLEKHPNWFAYRTSSLWRV